jgi:hypothetical protein
MAAEAMPPALLGEGRAADYSEAGTATSMIFVISA